MGSIALSLLQQSVGWCGVLETHDTLIDDVQQRPPWQPRIHQSFSTLSAAWGQAAFQAVGNVSTLPCGDMWALERWHVGYSLL
jgi:hypothetical protein